MFIDPKKDNLKLDCGST